jgi:transposase
MMPTQGISMKKLKTVLRLHFEGKLSQHQIATSLQLSVGVVNKYIKRATAAGLIWPLSEAEEQDEVLKTKLGIGSNKKRASSPHAIDFAQVCQELRSKGVTLQLLWEEYQATGAQGISYNHFCLLYRDWKRCQPQSMRQTHKAGDKVFVDYAGPTIDIIDRDTGEVRSAQLFVGTLGASNYTYAEASWSQQLPDWLASHRRMFEFFGGVPALVVPDNLKSGVTKACRYEPDVNPTYAYFIEYYGTAVLPARPYKPKDKAKVENAVLVAERWILARLRHGTFLGLAELNRAISELVTALNQRPFKKLPGSRASWFEEIDKPALRPLPTYPYEYIQLKKARVNVDYHIELDKHYYSVPFQLIRKEVELRYTPQRLECWYQAQQVALHVRSYRPGAHTTVPEHMPKSHQKHQAWSKERLLNWAATIGVATTRLVNYLLVSKPHPEQGYRSCLGLLGLSKRYGSSRLEKACERAWNLGARTRKSVASMLSHHLEEALLPQETALSPTCHHDNLRGKHHYH